jgi:hypothetical protein
MFTAPQPWDTALAALREKGLLPTHLDSAALRRLQASVRQGAVFSARMTQIRAVASLQDVVTGMLEGRLNLADAKLRLLGTLSELGYLPETGFPTDPASLGIPPAKAESLTDLSGTRRRELQIKTQYRMAANLGRLAAEDEDSAWQFPAWELVRIEGREQVRDWQTRWLDAGGTLTAGRMIATKDDPIWQTLGDGTGGYDDTLGNPYPPFAYGSGMGWRDVPREEAIDLGIIDADYATEIQDPDLAAAWHADARDLDPALLAQVAPELEITGGQIRLRQALRAELTQARQTYANRLLHWLTRLFRNDDYTRDTHGQFAPTSGGGKTEQREHNIKPSPDLESALGLETGKIYADVGHLARKHPEYFKTAQEAREHIDDVFARPNLILPGNRPDHRLIIREGDTPRQKAAVLEIEKRGGKYRVRSAYVMTPAQVEVKKGKSAGQVVRLGNSRVNSAELKTPSRRLSVLRNTRPADSIYPPTLRARLQALSNIISTPLKPPFNHQPSAISHQQ